MFKVTQVWQDEAGKWRAVVDINRQSQTFKFSNYPSLDEIQAAAQAFVDAQVVIE